MKLLSKSCRPWLLHLTKTLRHLRFCMNSSLSLWPVVFIHLCFCTPVFTGEGTCRLPKCLISCDSSAVVVLPHIVQETNGSKHVALVFNISHMICSETIFCSYTHTHTHTHTHTQVYLHTTTHCAIINRKRQIWNTQQCQCVHRTHPHTHTQPRTHGYGKVVQCVEPQRSWWMYHHPMVKSSKWHITGSNLNACSLHWCS